MNGSTWQFNRSWGVPRIAALICGLAILAYSAPVGAETFTLDDAASPIAVSIDGDTGRLSVTVKSTGMIWKNPDSGGDALTLSHAKQESPLRVTADAKAGDEAAFQWIAELKPDAGELVVAIGGDPASSLGSGVNYPYPFFPEDGSGYAIIPMFNGFAVPTDAVDWRAPWSHSRLEWLGGVDKDFKQGWMAIADPAADMVMQTARGMVAGQERIGGVFHWMGSNANPDMTPNLLSYERRAIYRFFDEGGYVAQAKRFREFAEEKGWVRTLREKAESNPQVDDLIGAPVIYLWGDGRSVAMLDAMKNAGINKALIQISINHLDHNGAFPNQEFANGDGWAQAVRERGYVSGIYDIYASARTAGGGGGARGGAGGDAARGARGGEAAGGEGARRGGDAAGVAQGEAAARGGGDAARGGDAPAARRGGGGGGTVNYSGFSYLWPSNAGEWAYVDAAGAGTGRASVCHEMAAKFALETRLPKHFEMFDLDAIFFDTVCAVDPRECYDKEHGHSASRAEDCANRASILEVCTGHFNKITGTEKLKSWAVPYTHWTEGQFRLGSTSTRGQYGAWNNNAYPEVMVDVQDIGEDLANVLNTGYQIPLLDLVYHDSVISVQHWHLVHNKLLYAWDLSDQFALIRGQAPMLNLVYAGERGTVGREIQGATDARDGLVWDSRWTTPHVAKRVVKTYEDVAKFHEQVGYMEMIDHRLLKDDFSVQVSEFSGDGGQSGKGVVVNFGAFDGENSMAGPDWTSEIRGQQLTVPVNSFATYEW